MAPFSDSLTESHHLHLDLYKGYCFGTARIDALCLRIRAYCEIVTYERCYHGRLQSESNFYPTGRRGAIGHRLILLSWFVRREEERPRVGRTVKKRVRAGH